jgi:Ca2+-binding RTX toxin-like protein
MKGGTASFGSGGQGDDSLVGSGGTTIDSLWGGQGNDVLRGLNGADFLSGDLGQDIIWGDDGGGTGNDTILGGGESDTIVGGNGDDSIRGGQGNDYIDTDAALVFDSTNGVNRIPTNADVVAGNDTVWGDAGDDTIGRETATGDKVYLGGDGNDSVVGGEDNDSITGDAGDDILRGGNGGRDTITGGVGNDSIQGGNEAAPGPVIGSDPTTFFSNAANLTDSLTGAEGNDTINGNQGNDFIQGGIGQDSLLGGDQDDAILGEDQADILQGEAGFDSLVGGRDNDTLDGGVGSDTLTGGLIGDTAASTTPGEDVFRYNLNTLVTFGTVGTTSGLPVAPSPIVTGNVPGIPGLTVAATLQNTADWITDFQVGTDKLQVIGRSTTVGTTTYNFGSTYSLTPTFGQIGSIAAPGINGTNTLIYIESSDPTAPVAGYDPGVDVVLAILQGVDNAAFQASSSFI